jgi:hypothetical protein
VGGGGKVPATSDLHVLPPSCPWSHAVTRTKDGSPGPAVVHRVDAGEPAIAAGSGSRDGTPVAQVSWDIGDLGAGGGEQEAEGQVWNQQERHGGGLEVTENGDPQEAGDSPSGKKGRGEQRGDPIPGGVSRARLRELLRGTWELWLLVYFLWWDRDLNSGLCPCQAGPHSCPFLCWVFCQAWNLDPPHLSLPSAGITGVLHRTQLFQNFHLHQRKPASPSSSPPSRSPLLPSQWKPPSFLPT